MRSLSQHTNSKIAELLLKSWGGYSPSVRREVLEALLSRPERVQTLLDSIAKQKVLAGQLEVHQDQVGPRRSESQRCLLR